MVRGVNGGCFVVENQKWVSEWSPPQSPAPRAGTGADWEGGGGGGGEEEEEVEEEGGREEQMEEEATVLDTTGENWVIHKIEKCSRILDRTIK